MSQVAGNSSHEERQISSLERQVESNPCDFEAHYNLGVLYRRKSRDDVAINHFSKAAQLRPGHYDACTNIVNILIKSNLYDQAEAVLMQFISQVPDSAKAYRELGSVLMHRGKNDAAAAAFKLALKLNPNDVTVTVKLALTLERRRQYEEALELIRPWLLKDPAASSLYISLAHRFGEEQQALEIGEKIAKQGGLSMYGARELHAQLGKLYDRLGRYDEAFVHFEAMNQCYNHQFDLKDLRQHIARIKAVFTAELFSRVPQASEVEITPVFIIGMPRSGTSLLEQVIASHPQVLGLGETTFVEVLAFQTPKLSANGNKFPESVTELSVDNFSLLARKYLEANQKEHADLASYQCITDKMPFNFLYLGLIVLMFPNVKVIHCRRHPMDCGLSSYFQNFGEAVTFTSSLTNIGDYYCEYEQLMTHWRDVLPDRLMELQYEDLVTKFEPSARKVIEYCGLEWDDACLDFHNSERFVTTVSYDQVRQPVYTKSVGRWRHYDHHLGPLKEALARCELGLEASP